MPAAANGEARFQIGALLLNSLNRLIDAPTLVKGKVTTSLGRRTSVTLVERKSNYAVVTKVSRKTFVKSVPSLLSGLNPSLRESRRLSTVTAKSLVVISD